MYVCMYIYTPQNPILVIYSRPYIIHLKQAIDFLFQGADLASDLQNRLQQAELAQDRGRGAKNYCLIKEYTLTHIGDPTVI